MDMISMQDFYRFTVSSVLYTAQNGVRYHREAYQHLTHPTYGLIVPVSEPTMWYVQDYGIFHLLEGSPYNPVLALLCLYPILELYLVSIARYLLWSHPYLFYEW